MIPSDMGFERWIQKVNEALVEHTGFTVQAFGAFPYWQEYQAGMTPIEAARRTENA